MLRNLLIRNALIFFGLMAYGEAAFSAIPAELPPLAAFLKARDSSINSATVSVRFTTCRLPLSSVLNKLNSQTKESLVTSVTDAEKFVSNLLGAEQPPFASTEYMKMGNSFKSIGPECGNGPMVQIFDGNVFAKWVPGRSGGQVDLYPLPDAQDVHDLNSVCITLSKLLRVARTASEDDANGQRRLIVEVTPKYSERLVFNNANEQQYSESTIDGEIKVRRWFWGYSTISGVPIPRLVIFATTLDDQNIKLDINIIDGAKINPQLTVEDFKIRNLPAKVIVVDHRQLPPHVGPAEELVPNWVDPNAQTRPAVAAEDVAAQKDVQLAPNAMARQTAKPAYEDVEPNHENSDAIQASAVSVNNSTIFPYLLLAIGLLASVILAIYWFRHRTHRG